MPRHRLTLAALASAVVPGLEVASAQPFTGGGDGAFDAALLTTAAGEHLVVRLAAHEAAADRIAAELRALAALTPGVRARLPFAVPVVRGSSLATRAHPAALVTTYLPGRRLRLPAVHAGTALPASVGTAIAALHALPTAVATGCGLPQLGRDASRNAAAAVIDRVADTRRVPGALIQRWRDALGDGSLWQFQPAIVHGSMAAETILTADHGRSDERMAGVLGWSSLGVGDPARDLAWALALPAPGAADEVFDRYHEARRGAADRELRQRAMLYAELELARWLLYGLDSADEAVVDDAVLLLRTLLASVQAETAGSLLHETMPVLSVAEVERMLAGQRHMVEAQTGPLRTVQVSTVPENALEKAASSSVAE